MTFESKPMPTEVCSCGAEFYRVATSLKGVERERASFREAHKGCRVMRVEWQRCPVCNGTGHFYRLFVPGTPPEPCDACLGTKMVVRPDEPKEPRV